ncbi:peptidase [Leptolyngbya sp. BL0902]|uniref:PPC domain-containing protein n=1 Tax=Leptolyngbya sp. BL0902 TaxID=1115757 RepID=UPI0018E8B257|nr:PPC domain-containing protein [Leptolyngbya sp. BL0902]QQE66580.1 peptidase [Leptolyngbya sp. BL0902]
MQVTSLLRHSLLLPATVLLITGTSLRAQAQQVYSPIPLPASREVTDTLSNRDIPTGFGGFARDYTVRLEAGDQVAIDVSSDEFDTMVALMGEDGFTIGENDDGPDGTTNSLLFARITQSGTYTVRIRAYAGQGSGQFRLKVARLREVP